MGADTRLARRSWLAVLTFASACVASTCGGGSSAGPSPTPPASAQNTWVLVGAGDIGECLSEGPELTARLIDSIDGTVFTAGDNAYFDGSRNDFLGCYEPSWGRHKARTRPTPGNHDYRTPGASAYFDYFGAAAGPRGLGYYSYPLGPWRVLALNSETLVGPTSPQVQWLRNELATDPTSCTIAIWHRPLFTSGQNFPNPDMKDIFKVLYDANVEIVINGHDHLYERFAPQDADGRADPARGIRQFTVGTGGIFLYQSVGTARNSQVLQSVWGVLKLTLTAGAYQWAFISAQNTGFGDVGTGTCH
jgi:hypothetical protein